MAITRSKTEAKAFAKKDFLSNPVLQVKECQGAINTACKKLGIARFTHHDLRHWFATRCIESGVDIPTVSRWLGHKDGGALAMKVYGHLRNQHSASMAKLVKFAPAENIIPLPTAQPKQAAQRHRKAKRASVRSA